MADVAHDGEKVLRGIPVSAGVCRGKILVLDRPDDTSIPRRELSEAELTGQLRRFEQALTETRHQILEVQGKVSQGMGAQDASIFDAHLLVLEDPTLIDEVTKFIHREKVTAEYAFHQVATGRT